MFKGPHAAINTSLHAVGVPLFLCHTASLWSDSSITHLTLCCTNICINMDMLKAAESITASRCYCGAAQQGSISEPYCSTQGILQRCWGFSQVLSGSNRMSLCVLDVLHPQAQVCSSSFCICCYILFLQVNLRV